MGKNDLLLIAAIVGGGYLILKTTKLGAALGGVGEGAAEAASGLGAGIGAAGRGLGGGIGMAGQATGLTIQDILGISALLRPVGAAGVAATGEVERWAEGRELEHTQEQEVDIAAHEKVKQELARIQAEMERTKATEEAERSRLIEEEKTQYVEFATTLPEKALAGFKYLGAAALASWSYSPIKLLQTYIQGQISVETEAAPQQATITGGGATAIISTSQIKRGSYSTLKEAQEASPTGFAYTQPTAEGYQPAPEYAAVEISEPEPAPEPKKPWYQFW